MDDLLSLWMLHAAPLWRQNLTKALSRQGLCELEARILVQLGASSAPELQKSLGAALATEPSTLARALQRLESQGLLLRHPDRADRRALSVALTEEGQAFHGVLLRTVRQAFRELYGPEGRTQPIPFLG